MSEHFRFLRIRARISQAQMAKLLGVSQPTISNVELGKRKLSKQQLQIASEIFRDALRQKLTFVPVERNAA